MVAEENDALVDRRLLKEEEGSTEGGIPNLTLKEVKEKGSMDELRKEMKSLEAWRQIGKKEGFPGGMVYLSSISFTKCYPDSVTY